MSQSFLSFLNLRHNIIAIRQTRLWYKGLSRTEPEKGYEGLAGIVIDL